LQKNIFFMKQIINTTNAPKAIGPYSQAALYNGMLFVSGQIPINPANGELVTGDIKNQAIQVMENIKAILTEAGMDFSHIIKASIFLSDMGNFGVINEIYGSYFTENPPARECIQAACLPRNVDVEISVIAGK
jgi:2-iminobutanoate/2-iminopropanoate deaminase